MLVCVLCDDEEDVVEKEDCEASISIRHLLKREGNLRDVKNRTTIGINHWLLLNLKPLLVLSVMTRDMPRMMSVKPTMTLLMISPNSYLVLCSLLNQYIIASTSRTQPAPMKNCIAVVLKTSDTASSFTRGLDVVEVTAFNLARESACAS